MLRNFPKDTGAQRQRSWGSRAGSQVPKAEPSVPPSSRPILGSPCGHVKHRLQVFLGWGRTVLTDSQGVLMPTALCPAEASSGNPSP